MKVITRVLQWSVFVFLIFHTAANAQIKIGDNPTVINSSAIMEIESANKGFLLPRLQLANVSQPAPLLQHVAGMIIYNTTTLNGLTAGCYYNDGTKWIAITSSTVTGLLSADNGLTNVAGVVKLGGNLIQPTVLTTTVINTLAVKGLAAGNTTDGDFVIIDKVTGVLKTIPYSVIENAINKKVDSNPVITAGTNTKITYDAKGLVTKGENAAITDIQGLQTELDKKAPLDSPVFTGTPKTTLINATSTADAVTNKSYVDDAVTAAKTSIVSQTITDGQTTTAPSENAVYDALVNKADKTYVDSQNALKADKTYVDSQDALKADKSYVDSQDALKAPIESPTFTGVARAVTPSVLSDNKAITTKEYVDAKTAQVKSDVISQSILLNNTTTAPSEDAVRKELDLKSPINAPVFTGIAKVPDITANTITDPLAITNKGYVDSQITTAGNIYTKDGTLADNRKVTLDGKNLDFIGNTATNPTRLAPDGTMTVGGNVNINNKVAGTNTTISGVQFTNDENGPGYAAASITTRTGDDKGKGQLSFNVKTATGIDTEAARITDKGNVLVGGTTDDNSAVLNVQSTTKGVLMPRQTKAHRDLITTPATGLQVYQTDTSNGSKEGQYLKTSTGWGRMLLEGDVKLDYYEAINTSGGTISGNAASPVAVHITGVDGSNNKNITVSDANTSGAARFDGVVIDNVASGAVCKVYVRYVSVNSNTSAYTQSASVFLSTGGSFTNDPSSLPFGVNVGKIFSVSPTNGVVLFSVYPITDFYRNQYERINSGTDETVFTGRVVSSLEPLDDTYLTNKKYVDEAIAFAQLYQGAWNAATNTPPLADSSTAQRGWTYDVTVASGVAVSWPNLCSAPITILKGEVIKFDGNCWVVLDRPTVSATTTQEGTVLLDTSISSSTSLVPTSNLLKSVSDANQSHIANTNNPHSVTKAQVGLANVDDTSDANKPVSGPQQTALDLKADKANGAAQITDSNPYGNIGTLAGVTQAAINAGINTKLGEKTQLNGTGLVRMAGTTVSYDNTAYAPLDSPVFTGDAQAMEPSLVDNDNSIATTSFVNKNAFGLWSKTGNNINDTDFIGSINNKNLVFKAYNIERMSLDYSLGQVNIGTSSSPTKLRINTSSELSKNEALTMITNDANPLYMTFEAYGSGTGSHYFDISSYTYDNTNFVTIPANISFLSEGGIFSIGKDDFTSLSEKLEVNGNVRANGFKIPNGTSSQFLMADGSVSALDSSGWALTGNAGTTPGTNFIGTTDNKDVVFKANNIERMRINNANGKLSVGDNTNPGSLLITTSSSASTAPFAIATSDVSPLVMTIQDIGFAPNNIFSIDVFRAGSSNIPASLSLLSSGGIMGVGFNDYTGLTEKIEVNGNVRATGFKVPNGTATQYLMADGSVAQQGAGGLVVAGGVDGTMKRVKDSFNNADTGLYVSSNSVTAYGSTNVVNTAFGTLALAQAVTGRFNTAFGYNTLYNITVGEGNTAVGYEAGANSNSTNSIFLGANTKSAGASNEIVIGTAATGNGSNTTTLGNTNITATYLRGTVSSNGAYTNTSDVRLKTNITKLENGLVDVMKLNPVVYDKKRMLESDNYDLHEIGFIAQDLQKIFPNGVVSEGKDKDKLLSVNYDALIPVLTKAIQDQQKIIDEEKAKNDKQQKEIDELKAMVKQLMDKK